MKRKTSDNKTRVWIRLPGSCARKQRVFDTDKLLANHAKAIRTLGKRVIKDVIEIGRRLIECKRLAGHGHWLPWLEREFGWSDKTAERFMSVHALAGKSDKLSNLNLPISGLYLLAAPSTPNEARVEIINRSMSGETIALAEIKETITEHKATGKRTPKPRKTAADKTADRLEIQIFQIEVIVDAIDDWPAIDQLTTRRKDFEQQLRKLAARILALAERIAPAAQPDRRRARADDGGRSKIVRGRGMARASLELIEAMHAAAKAAQPITGRGIGYKLFTAGLIPSMATLAMARVYRLLRVAREQGLIPWEWIVDETRALERCPSWDDPADFVHTVGRAYRRDFWNHQPVRVEVWSEKGTVRGVLAPVLDQYGVGFRVMHGFSGATTIYDVAQDDDGRPLIVLYVGDYDPSGLYMSEHDLSDRLAKYGGDHVLLKRIALKREQTDDLPSFPAKDKRKDPRFRWFTHQFGNRCWELDALDPNDLRAFVEAAIESEIEPTAWRRCAVVEKAERESLRTVLDSWKGATP